MPFTKDGKLTLVLNKNYSDFQVSQDVAELINSQLSFQSSSGNLAKAINQVNIEVHIPPQYQSDPVSFVSQVLSLPMLEPQTEARVVINPRAGSIVIGGDVEIGAVVVTHKNMVIETADNPAAARAGIQADRYLAAATTNGDEVESARCGTECREGADRRHHRNHQRLGARRKAAWRVGRRVERSFSAFTRSQRNRRKHMALTITPNLNSNQFTTPKSAGLDALNAAAASGKGDDEVRERVRFVRRRNVLQPNDQIDAQNA